MTSKARRLEIFLNRMSAAPKVSSPDEALALLSQTLNEVEDEFSDVPYRPENWRTDGRMYPPQEDSRVKYPGRPSLRKYRSKGHYSFFGSNGSIRIELLDGSVLIDKPGADGLKTQELDN